MESPNRFLTPAQRSHLEDSLTMKDLRPEYYRRIKIMLLADDGHSQTQICDQLGCSHETARYWIKMAQSSQVDWRDRPMGRPKTISEDYRNRLKELVSKNPREFGYGFRRWTARWLAKHLEQEFNITVSNRYINYLLKDMGLSTRNLTDVGNQMATLMQTG